MAEIASNLEALASRWATADAGERSNFQSYVNQLCAALLVEPPRPKGSGYEFELTVEAISVTGVESKNFIDCWKAGHFAMEGKDVATARRGSAAYDNVLRRAYGQVRNYAHHVPGETPPPYLMVLDVGATLIVWDRWAGNYGGFEAGRRIDLRTLHERPDDIALLRDIWENPAARDRRGAAQAVTTEIAGRLAELAAALEGRGHDQEDVARFLMRVVFSCFAEDIGLLPAESFRMTVTEAGLRGSPAEFSAAVEGLWRMMDTGGRMGPMRFLRFNGHFFKEATALPLTRDELVLLEAAARADWTEVEPAIFGTLLTRALDPEERHRLGAEFTPPGYIERLVRPTIEEPVQERWTAVQAEVVQLLATEKPKDRERAATSLREFHAWLRGLRILDPACGSGNFLYVAMHALKRIELEVLRSIDRVTGETALRMEEIGPWQFYGIEVKPWAREIAELTLWIGFHQFWKQHHDVQPPEPILRDTGTLACYDAVLRWTNTVPRPERDRADPTRRVRHPVSGRLVPDPTARRAYIEYTDAAPAEWPAADFIVGNPPYIGGKRIRHALGDGYTDALHRAYPALPDAADFVMYWFDHAARAVATGQTIRAGFITTNSIRQKHNRPVIDRAVQAGASLAWAIPDHPWVEDANGAAVRVAMVVLADAPTAPTLGELGASGAVTYRRVTQINSDLSATVNVAPVAAVPLQANAGLCSNGIIVNGPGFLLRPPEAAALRAADARNEDCLRAFIGGDDIVDRPRDLTVIDFSTLSVDEARTYPSLYTIVHDRVKPDRDGNRDRGIRENWWRFHRTRQGLRDAVAPLRRYIVTVETMKHRVFTFLDAHSLADHGLVCIASDDAFHLGALSSSIHVWWALAAGGRLGVGNDPRYNKTVCFDSFPFPDPSPSLRQQIATVAEQIETARRRALDADERVTITRIYNVLSKVRAGAPLTPDEDAINVIVGGAALRDWHDTLDTLVAAAYGWSGPLDRDTVLAALVDLHTARVAAEGRGEVQWLRPAWQQTRRAATRRGRGAARPMAAAAPPPPTKRPWPADAIGQLTTVRRLIAESPKTVEEIAGALRTARRELIRHHLDALVLVGEIACDASGRYALSVSATT